LNNLDNLLWVLHGEGEITYQASFALQGEHYAGVFQEVEGGAVAPVSRHEMDAGAAVLQKSG
jgi:hypothetical protein